MMNVSKPLDELAEPDRLAVRVGGQMASNRIRRGLVATGVAGIVLLAIAGGVALVLGTHRAPSPLALSTPTAVTASGAAGGNWTVATGSEVGYRVKEQFIDQPGPTEAVARTTKISGGFRVEGAGSTLRAVGMHFTADLKALQSQDQYANYKVYQRDFFIRTIYLQTDQFPNADFSAASVTIPPGIDSGPVSITVAGNLKVHGVTKAVTTQFQAQRNATGVEVAGSINVDMRDYGVEVPSISFTTAQPGVVIEYHLLFVRA
jgi:polyisoprenoid-binding protein YceI